MTFIEHSNTVTEEYAFFLSGYETYHKTGSTVKLVSVCLKGQRIYSMITDTIQQVISNRKLFG